MMRNTDNVPTTLLVYYFSGLATDSPTALEAAKCITATTLCCRSACNTASVLQTSSLTTGPHLTKCGCPVEKLSKQTGTRPASDSALQQCDPMKPAPPVTKIDG